MASTNNLISVTKDYFTITIAGYQLKISKLQEEHQDFEEFVKNLEFEDEE